LGLYGGWVCTCHSLLGYFGSILSLVLRIILAFE